MAEGLYGLQGLLFPPAQLTESHRREFVGEVQDLRGVPRTTARSVQSQGQQQVPPGTKGACSYVGTPVPSKGLR